MRDGFVPEHSPWSAHKHEDESEGNVVAYVGPENDMAGPESEVTNPVGYEDAEVLEENRDFEEKEKNTPDDEFDVLEL
jgi:hypothetical protein